MITLHDRCLSYIRTFPGLPVGRLTQALTDCPHGERRRLSQLRAFWKKVEVTRTCWLWIGRVDKDGYGRYGDMRRAHRQSYAWFVGPIPTGQHVTHVCDTPTCVNPDHLRAATHQENIQEIYDRHRKPDQGSNNRNSKLTEAQVAEMRALYASGTVTQTVLEERFGVDQTVVSDIVTGRAWRHVPGGSLGAPRAQRQPREERPCVVCQRPFKFSKTQPKRRCCSMACSRVDRIGKRGRP